MVYDTNAFLTQDQMTVNAQDLLNFFLGHGWTKNAICGMLGNMQTESTINYGIWQNLDSTNTSGGFGLVQWTPSTVYTNWANSNGYGNDHVNGEKQRILYEVANNVQWIPTSNYNITFAQFIVSTDTPDNLASAWMYDYERPSPSSITQTEPTRRSQALNWYNTLTGGTPITSSQNEIVTFLLCGSLNGW